MMPLKGPKGFIALFGVQFLTIVALTGLLITAMISHRPDDELWRTNTQSVFLFFGTLIALIVIPSPLLGKMRKVAIGHIATLEVMGTRSKTQVLTEGWYWIPPLTKIVEFDHRERQIVLPISEVLSSDNVPIRFKGQLQIRLTNPHKYSDVLQADQTLIEYGVDAFRNEVSSHTALEIALSEELTSAVVSRVSRRAINWGITVISSAITELRLPAEIEQYAQVARVIRQQNPDLSAKVILDALQADRGSIRKIVLESSSLESAAVSIVKALFR